MANTFEEPLFRELTVLENKSDKNIIKASKSKSAGKTKISVEEESHHGVKIVLKKDENDSLKEIKFVCSCGQSKSIVLDYSE